MIKVYYGLAFFSMLIWTVILLYGLLRDISIPSKLVRLVSVYVLWKIVPPWSGPSIWGFVEHVGQSVPVWVIVLLVTFLSVYIHGFKLLLKDRQN